MWLQLMAALGPKRSSSAIGSSETNQNRTCARFDAEFAVGHEVGPFVELEGDARGGERQSVHKSANGVSITLEQ
jgi:hypothetical protein